MKKLMTLMLGLAFLVSTSTLFAQDTGKDTTKKSEKKKGKKKKGEKSTT